jgi:hypothetical protein
VPPRTAVTRRLPTRRALWRLSPGRGAGRRRNRVAVRGRDRHESEHGAWGASQASQDPPGGQRAAGTPVPDTAGRGTVPEWPPNRLLPVSVRPAGTRAGSRATVARPSSCASSRGRTPGSSAIPACRWSPAPGTRPGMAPPRPAALTLRDATPRLPATSRRAAVNGTSTRRASAERSGGWWKPERRRRRMDPGASGPNGGGDAAQ